MPYVSQANPNILETLFSRRGSRKGARCWYLRENVHPMNFCVIAGLGRVPGALKSPNTYRQLDKAAELGEFVGGPVWYVQRSAESSCDEEESLGVVKAAVLSTVGEGDRLVLERERGCVLERTALKDVKWFGVVDARDGAENVDDFERCPAEYEDAIIDWRTIGHYEPPLDKASGLAYFNVQSGDMLVIDPTEHSVRRQISVGNVANGKWFWRLNEGETQLLCWHESVHQLQETYVFPFGENLSDPLVTQSRKQESEQHTPDLSEVRQEWLRAQGVARWLCAEKLGQGLELFLAAFMATDSESCWWSQGAVQDGYLQHRKLVPVTTTAIGFFDAQLFRSKDLEVPLPKEKFVYDAESMFVSDYFDRQIVGPFPRGFPGGCCAVVENSGNYPVHFRLHAETRKVVAARVVFDEALVPCDSD